MVTARRDLNPLPVRSMFPSISTVDGNIDGFSAYPIRDLGSHHLKEFSMVQHMSQGGGSKYYGDRLEGFEPSAVRVGIFRPGSAPIRVLDGHQ